MGCVSVVSSYKKICSFILVGLQLKQKIEEFTKWVLYVGNGKAHILTTQKMNFDDDIQIPEQYCIHSPTSCVDDILRNTYDGLEHAYKCKTYLDQLNDLIKDKILKIPETRYCTIALTQCRMMT